jgi:heat shock protein HslJ
MRGVLEGQEAGRKWDTVQKLKRSCSASRASGCEVKRAAGVGDILLPPRQRGVGKIRRPIRLWQLLIPVFLVLFIAALAACGKAGEEAEELEPPSGIHDTSWIVTAYEDRNGQLVDVLDGTEITANFSQEKADGGTVYGFTGCNDYVGDYSVSGDNVWPGIDLVLTTQNTCTEPAGIMEQEEDFIRALIFSRKWEIDELEMLFTEGIEGVTLVTFSYAGEAAEYVREEEFVVPADGIEFTDTFDDGDEDWIAGFADLPADYNPEIYELDSEWRELPDDLGGYGVYMQGHNRSDDLFMFLKRRVDGLEAGATYQATFRLVLASNVPPGLSGVGGSPGESVFVKVGATTVEPIVEEAADGWLRMNIDKGNQASEGEDMINIGDMANPNITSETAGAYERMEQNSSGRDFEVTADENGVVWFIVGTDSGFEGLTTLYYDTITVVLAPK